MSVNFAGARSVDDRRRRRISQTTDISIATEKNPRLNQRGMIPKALVSSPELLPESPVHALIPKTPGKFWTMLASVFCLWGICATAGVSHEIIPHMSDWGFSRFFNLQNGTFWNCWTTSCLMISAQLSWVIYWYRSHGTDDFQGHYRTWLWTSLACAVVAFLHSTEIGYIITEQFGRRVHLYNQQTTGLIWLAGLYAVGYELTRKIDQEIGECRSAFIFMILFVATSLVGGWLLLKQESRFLQLHQYAWLTLSHSLVAFFLLATIFCFTRRTLYITAEAAERRKSPVFSFVFHIPQLSKTAVIRFITFIQFCTSLVYSFFKRGNIEEETSTSKKPKRVAKKPNSKVKRSTGARKRKLRETLDDEIEEEYAEEEAQQDTDDDESQTELEDDKEDDESEVAKETFDEEAWLQKEIEREAKLKKQTELERQEQQKQEFNKQKFRLDTSHQQSNKPQQQHQAEREEEYTSKKDKYEQESYSNQTDEDDDNQNSDGNGGFDPELFKGLSKREKRTLKQQLREQERQQGKRS